MWPRAVARSARLSQLVELVEQGARVADIATDHAWVPIALLSLERVSSAIGIDLHAAPLERAAANAARLRVADRLSLRRGSGLRPLEAGEADTVMMAGVGGSLMAALLDERDLAALGVSRLILQTYAEPEVARAWVAARGWGLEAELMIEEREMFYTTLVARRELPAAAMDERALWMGPLLCDERSAGFMRWCEVQRAEIDGILRTIPTSHPMRALYERRRGWLADVLDIK